MDVLEMLREGSYTAAGKTVEFTDADTIRELADLYAVVNEDHPTGTSNLENDQLRTMLSDTFFANKPLNNAQWDVLKRLRVKYADRLAELQASPDKEGQDYFPAAGSGPVSG